MSDFNTLLSSREIGVARATEPQKRQSLDGVRVVHDYHSDAYFLGYYEFSLLLGGMSGDAALSIAHSIAKHFEAGAPLWALSLEQAFDFILTASLNKQLPNSAFHCGEPGLLELHYAPTDSFSQQAILDAVSNSYNNGVPLEFSYTAHREDEDGELKEETHIRRVNVTSMDGLGFNGRHSRGTRRFSLSSVNWALNNSVIPHEVQPEPLVHFSLEEHEGRKRFVMEFGRWGDNGKLLLGPDRRYEFETRSENLPW